MSRAPSLEDESAWTVWQDQWTLRADTVYLNHGSFGPPPRPVIEARRRWQTRLYEQPMDFFVRQMTPAWLAARDSLAHFIGCSAEDVIFVENATAAMNIVADGFPLHARDHVVLTNHEYGAVFRIWERACQRVGAEPPVVAQLPDTVESTDQVVEAVFAAVDEQTRLIVVSHITSATAMILPVAEICRRAQDEGIAVCVDGPHAPAQIPLDIASIGCDFYTASCHKWLCAPFGSGFLAAGPQYREGCPPTRLSWGLLPPAKPGRWTDEFVWCGTRDPSAYLAVPDAIEFMQHVGLDAFHQRTHALAKYARRQIEQLTGLATPFPDNTSWYGSMALAPLPPTDAFALQQRLWSRHGIEVPVVEFEGHEFIRVSCHLYNTPTHIDRLVAALTTELR